MWAARGGTCHIEDRREHDIDAEQRFNASDPSQKRPPPAHLTAYLHILSSFDVTVL